MDRGSLGAWSSDEFKVTVLANSVAGADAGLPLEVRFVSSIAKLVRLRQAQSGTNADPMRLGIFLLQPQVPTTATAAKREPMLNNGLTALTGRLWFVNAVASMGHFIDLASDDNDTVFKFITDEIKAGETPTIVVDPRPITWDIRFYEKGLSNAEEYSSITISEGTLTLAEVFAAIEHIYRKRLVTPDAQLKAGKLWENDRKVWPAENAEDLVSMYLTIGLTTAFPTYNVEAEQPLVTGRLDIEIDEPNPLDRSKVTKHAVLELKILRSFNSSGTSISEAFNLDWILKGLEQAAAYRTEQGHRHAALCCFDMRKEDTGEKCFEHVKALSEQHTVALKRWYLYSTSGRYRPAPVPGDAQPGRRRALAQDQRGPGPDPGPLEGLAETGTGATCSAAWSATATHSWRATPPGSGPATGSRTTRWSPSPRSGRR